MDKQNKFRTKNKCLQTEYLKKFQQSVDAVLKNIYECQQFVLFLHHSVEK